MPGNVHLELIDVSVDLENGEASFGALRSDILVDPKTMNSVRQIIKIRTLWARKTVTLSQ